MTPEELNGGRSSLQNCEITLRDEFAMSALNGMISTSKTVYSADNHKLSTPTQFAEIAYEYADAMMKKRNRNDR